MEGKPDGVEHAADTAAAVVGTNLLQAIVDQLERIEAWRKLDTLAQDNAIDSLRETLRVEVRRALGVVFAGQYPACVATLTGVNFGDEISARLKIGKAAHHRHELADATGQPVLVVMADPDGYLAELDKVRARAKQGELFDPVEVVEGDAGGEPAMYLGDLETGEPSDDLVDQLRAAGLDVTFNDTARWSAADRAQARAWALEQNNLNPPDEFTALPPPCLAPLLASRR